MVEHLTVPKIYDLRVCHFRALLIFRRLFLYYLYSKHEQTFICIDIKGFRDAFSCIDKIPKHTYMYQV